MINWLMDLIAKSITNKSIHHFSLDFGSALLANIIHAQSTLLMLSSKPVVAQQVISYSNAVDGKNAPIYEIRYPSFSSYAFAYLSFIFIQRIILQDSERSLSFCGTYQ